MVCHTELYFEYDFIMFLNYGYQVCLISFFISFAYGFINAILLITSKRPTFSASPQIFGVFIIVTMIGIFEALSFYSLS